MCINMVLHLVNDSLEGPDIIEMVPVQQLSTFQIIAAVPRPSLHAPPIDLCFVSGTVLLSVFDLFMRVFPVDIVIIMNNVRIYLITYLMSLTGF